MLNDKLIRWLSRDLPEKSSGSTAQRAVTLATDIGLIRKENQDRVACLKVGGNSSGTKPFIAIALSDGMGGMKNGRECAIRTISTFFDSLVRNRGLHDLDRLSIAASDANKYVYDYAQGYGGATLSALLISERRAITLNIGDSRIYAETKGDEKKLKRITIDDSLAEVIGGEGRELLQFIGMGESIRMNVNIVHDEFERLLITSDGIHFINQNTLEDIFTKSQDINTAANRLSTIVRWSGAPDNASLAALSLNGLKGLLIDRTDSSIEIWDPFGDLHFVWLKEEPLNRKDQYSKPEIKKEKHLIKNNQHLKPEEQHIEPKEVGEEKYAPPELTPIARRITRSRKKPTKKEKEQNENLQIVIDMGASAKDDANDNSK